MPLFDPTTQVTHEFEQKAGKRRIRSGMQFPLSVLVRSSFQSTSARRACLEIASERKRMILRRDVRSFSFSPSNRFVYLMSDN